MDIRKRDWLELQFYKDLKGTLRRHKSLLGSIHHSLLPAGIRPDEIENTLKTKKAQISTPVPPLRVRRFKSSVLKVTEAFGVNSSSRTRIKVKVGGEAKVERNDSYSYPLYYVTVGYMWLDKVWNLFYSTEEQREAIKPWLIIKAERVRMNSREVHLYEALCIQKGHKEPTPLYVAKTVIGGHVGIGYSVKQAFNEAMETLSQKMDEAIQGEKRDD